MSVAQQLSRPSSPVPRPKSRSERLLRDALLRDDLERSNPPPVPTLHRTHSKRRRSNSNAQSSHHGDEEQDEDDDPAIWSLLRGTLSSPNMQAHTANTTRGSHLIRNKSTSHVPSAPQEAAPNPRRHTSPSPPLDRPPLPRPASSSVIANAVPIPASRDSHARPMSQYSSSPRSGSSLTPHERVLRARLERVLKGGEAEHKRRSAEVGDYPSIRRGHSKTPSAGTDFDVENWKWGIGDVTNSPTLSDSSNEQNQQQSHETPTSTAALPLTPPQTPPCSGRADGDFSALSRAEGRLPPGVSSCAQFNARQASVQCRAIEGYVSFASVEGLGIPDGLLDDAVEEEMQTSTLTDGVKGLHLNLNMNVKTWRVWPWQEVTSQ